MHRRKFLKGLIATTALAGASPVAFAKSIPTNSVLDFGGGDDFTIEFWAKSSKDSLTDIRLTKGVARFVMDISDKGDDVWHHFTIEKEGPRTRTYVDHTLIEEDEFEYAE